MEITLLEGNDRLASALIRNEDSWLRVSR